MGKILAFVVVAGLLIWGAIATGVVRISGGDDPETTVETDEQADTSSLTRQPLPSPDFPSDDREIRRAEDAPEDRPIMQKQVVLERLGFSAGVIDGQQGQSFTAALRGFQMANDLEITGTLDEATEEALSRYDRIPSTRQITLTEDFVNSELTEEIPEGAQAQARLTRLGYTSLMEKLAERFHTTPATLRNLNGGSIRFEAGETVTVPNIGNDRITTDSNRSWLQTLASLGVASEQPEAARIVVDESDGVLMVFDEDERLIAQFPATMGSEHDPLPLGEWEILGNSYNPTFHYNPELLWDVEDSEDSVALPPGPNNPVGVVWIDLSKEHYGIHGTPEPQNIGRTESHGCIRLTNWDAARLAQMVRSGITAEFRR